MVVMRWPPFCLLGFGWTLVLLSRLLLASGLLLQGLAPNGLLRQGHRAHERPAGVAPARALAAQGLVECPAELKKNFKPGPLRRHGCGVYLFTRPPYGLPG